ncbi:TPA: sulfatase-like hydrolase/transferase [Klebsiella oxytoca]|nr:sulfatase-like hydrolase/transferase [Citrobacter freundii]HBM2877345.1 sulfatase-like hydrolase/transferase [Klebsiella oxytoca]HBU8667805.1 sulfatase-like hydrolase/transferase [Klebsiella oxytoca]
MNKNTNVLFILADNIGWGDIGAYGGTVPTPNIDRMVKDGLRFNNYTVECQCTPTRSALLTGRLPVRSGTFAVPRPGGGDYGLSPWEYTLANLFKDAGYDTVMYGKWHLGQVEGRLPTDQGFDEWWGIKNTSDEASYSQYKLFEQSGGETPYVWSGKAGEESKREFIFDLDSRSRMDREITRRTIDFLADPQRHAKPFFAYIGLTSIHPPINVAQEFKGTSGGGPRADSLIELDARVGQIRKALVQHGLSENTILVFSSDNAALQLTYELGGSNGPWRGGFFTPPFEGAYRVPCVVVWPDHIDSNRTSNQMFTAVDWLPTLAAACNLNELIPTDRAIDGLNAWPSFIDENAPTARDHVVLYGPDGEIMAVKWHTMKVIYRYCEGADKPIVTPSWPIVFDLLTDPTERYNMMDTHQNIHWVEKPVQRIIDELNISMEKHPNIQPGQIHP